VQPPSSGIITRILTNIAVINLFNAHLFLLSVIVLILAKVYHSTTRTRTTGIE